MSFLKSRPMTLLFLKRLRNIRNLIGVITHKTFHFLNGFLILNNKFLAIKGNSQDFHEVRTSIFIFTKSMKDNFTLLPYRSNIIILFIIIIIIIGFNGVQSM